MDGPPRAHGLRAPACSCEVVVGLAADPSVRRALTQFGARLDELERARAEIHASVATEPSDWRQRGTTRDNSPLAQLLAIVRSADCHGYRVLEAMGVRCPELRRSLALGPRATTSSFAAPRRARPSLRERSPRSIAGPPTPERVRDGQPTLLERPARSANRLDRDGDRSEPGDEPTAAARPRRQVDAPVAWAAVMASNPSPLRGRDRELGELRDALARMRGRPVALVGPPGCGRAAIACHLRGRAGEPARMASALALPDDEAQLREDLAALAKTDQLLVLRDVDAALGEAPPAWIPLLVAAWLRGEPRMVWLATQESIARLFAGWPALRDAVDPVVVAPLGAAATAEVLGSVGAELLAAHGVSLAADLRTTEIVRLADNYLVGSALPGRAIDLLDLAAARCRRLGSATLDRASMLDLVAERSGLPRVRIEARGDQDAIELERRIHERVVGHDAAIARVAEHVRRNRAGLGGARPVVSALLLGPSGVGKTEIAKALAWALFDRDDALVRLDMSEYAEPHAVARIVGAPPGYVGHEQGGTLSDPLLRRPHCVVLLDEIEKAHRDVHQLLLQVLDDGRLTDGRGRTIDFRHAAVVMTSNLGSGALRERSTGPVLDPDEVLAIARAAFPIELWNRIEAPLVMQPLAAADLIRICGRLLRASSDRLQRERGIRFEFSEAVCRHLVASAGCDPRLGARPLRHVVAREVEAKIADLVLRGRLRAGTSASFEVRRGELVLG